VGDLHRGPTVTIGLTVLALVALLVATASVTVVVALAVSRRRGPGRAAPAAAPGATVRRTGPASAGADLLEDLGQVHDLVDAVHERIRASHAPLSVDAVVEAARTGIGRPLGAEAVLVLLSEDDGRTWRVTSSEGTARPRELHHAELPVALRTPPPAEAPVVRRQGGEGLAITGESHGAYVWLQTRGQVTGLLAVERRGAPFSDQDRDVLAQATGPLGLALSTAVVFERLRGLGAGVERQRIGEQLHDQFAQALAFTGLELDRLRARYPDDPDITALRDEVRGSLGELRERLRELRLRCTEARGLDQVLREHVAHLERRTGLRSRLWVAEGFLRPPPLVEDQLLQIAIELLDLARRAEGVSSVQLLLTTEPGRARLVGRDDGDGRPERALPPASARLLAQVRERAVAIDALVDVLARPGEGTEVAVTVRDVATVPRWV
jgi:nitrate/nitrite-specific signal transduction histidine kinase